MDMTEEALKLLITTGQQAQAATLHELPGGGRRVLLQIGNELKEYEVEPKPRGHQVHSLADLIDYAKCGKEGRYPDPVIWYEHTGVVLVLDDVDRRDRVVFPLTMSQRFMVLRTLAREKPSFQQDRFVFLLRVELGLDSVLVAKFRKLDWENGDKGTANVFHGDARLSRSVIAKVQGVDELPEEIVVPVPIYQQTGERQEYLIKCNLDVDAVNHMFRLLPKPDELEYAIDLAQASIAQRLSESLEEIPIYYGAP